MAQWKKIILDKENHITLTPASRTDVPAEAGVIYIDSDDSLAYVNPDGTWQKIGSLSAVEEDTSPKLGGELNAQAHSIGFTEQTITSSSGSATIDWRNGNKATITLAEDVTLTFTNPSYSCNLVLKVVQDSTGGHSLTLPTGIKWSGGAPTLTTTANAVDIISFLYDGTYYGIASLNFS